MLTHALCFRWNNESCVIYFKVEFGTISAFQGWEEGCSSETPTIVVVFVSYLPSVFCLCVFPLCYIAPQKQKEENNMLVFFLVYIIFAAQMNCSPWELTLHNSLNAHSQTHWPSPSAKYISGSNMWWAWFYTDSICTLYALLVKIFQTASMMLMFFL